MANYRNLCTSQSVTLWRGDKAYGGAIRQLGRLAQDTVELWSDYDPDVIKIKDV